MAGTGVGLPPLPRVTILLLVGWNVLGLVILVAVAGPLVLLLWVVALVLTVIQVAVARHRLAQPFDARATPTGVVITPPPPVGPQAAGSVLPRRSWSGAAQVPTALGGINVTTPLAQLSIDHGEVLVRIRPGVMALLFGYRPAPLAPRDVEAVVPITRTMSRGVAIRPKGRPAAVFLSGRAPQILAELERAGFPVDRREHRLRLWGRAR